MLYSSKMLLKILLKTIIQHYITVIPHGRHVMVSQTTGESNVCITVYLG